MLTNTELRVIEELRRKGFAVVVFDPDELNGVDAGNVEDVMVERGWNAIDHDSRDMEA